MNIWLNGCMHICFSCRGCCPCRILMLMHPLSFENRISNSNKVKMPEMFLPFHLRFLRISGSLRLACAIPFHWIDFLPQFKCAKIHVSLFDAPEWFWISFHFHDYIVIHKLPFSPTSFIHLFARHFVSALRFFLCVFLCTIVACLRLQTSPDPNKINNPTNTF